MTPFLQQDFGMHAITPTVQTLPGFYLCLRKQYDLQLLIKILNLKTLSLSSTEEGFGYRLWITVLLLDSLKGKICYGVRDSSIKTVRFKTICQISFGTGWTREMSQQNSTQHPWRATVMFYGVTKATVSCRESHCRNYVQILLKEQSLLKNFPLLKLQNTQFLEEQHNPVVDAHLTAQYLLLSLQIFPQQFKFRCKLFSPFSPLSQLTSQLFYCFLTAFQHLEQARLRMTSTASFILKKREINCRK